MNRQQYYDLKKYCELHGNIGIIKLLCYWSKKKNKVLSSDCSSTDVGKEAIALTMCCNFTNQNFLDVVFEMLTGLISVQTDRQNISSNSIDWERTGHSGWPFNHWFSNIRMSLSRQIIQCLPKSQIDFFSFSALTLNETIFNKYTVWFILLIRQYNLLIKAD